MLVSMLIMIDDGSSVHTPRTLGVRASVILFFLLHVSLGGFVKVPKQLVSLSFVVCVNSRSILLIRPA